MNTIDEGPEPWSMGAVMATEIVRLLPGDGWRHKVDSRRTRVFDRGNVLTTGQFRIQWRLTAPRGWFAYYAFAPMKGAAVGRKPWATRRKLHNVPFATVLAAATFLALHTFDVDQIVGGRDE